MLQRNITLRIHNILSLTEKHFTPSEAHNNNNKTPHKHDNTEHKVYTAVRWVTTHCVKGRSHYASIRADTGICICIHRNHRNHQSKIDSDDISKLSLAPYNAYCLFNQLFKCFKFINAINVITIYYYYEHTQSTITIYTIQDRSPQLRPVASECDCYWLRDTVSLDCGNRSWICNSLLDTNFLTSRLNILLNNLLLSCPLRPSSINSKTRRIAVYGDSLQYRLKESVLPLASDVVEPWRASTKKTSWWAVVRSLYTVASKSTDMSWKVGEGLLCPRLGS